MKRALVEKYMVVVLFILVLVTFSFAERDSKKLDKLYTTASKVYKEFTIAFQFEKADSPASVKN